MHNSKEQEEMFNRKEWISVFVRIDFRGWSIIDIQRQKEKKYDISTSRISNFPSDFMDDDGQFNHWQYCICLIKKILDLSYTDFSKFLKYQSASMEVPLDWLDDLDDLLRFNKSFELMKPYRNRFKLFREAIHDECVLLSTSRPEESIDLSSVTDSVNELKVIFYLERLVERMDKRDDYRAQISFCKESRAKYLQVENANENAVFVRVVDKMLDCRETVVSKEVKMKVWEGTAKALARYHVYNNMIRDAEGRFIVDPCIATEARRICERYCKVNGGFFKFTTIQTEIGKVVRKIKSSIDTGNQNRK